MAIGLSNNSSGSSGSGVTDGDKGDITVSSSGATWTIDNDAVSNDKLGDIATNTIKGRNSSGTGSVEDLTTTEVRTLINVEDGATADQTASEIKTLVDSATDSNVFTDADHTKLDGIESGATADQTASEIKTLVDSATDSNVFTDAEKTKLTNLLSLTTKGDLLSNNGSSNVALGVGTNGQVLVADSNEASGLKWQGNNTIGTKVIVQGSMDSTQSFSGGTAEKVDFVDNVTGGFDLNSEWDNTNHKFVVGSSGAGVYQFKSAYFIPNNAGWSRIFLEKNGTPIDFYYGNDWENQSSSWDTPNGIWNIELAVGDEICFYIYSSTNFTFNATYHSQNVFQITKIGDSVTIYNAPAEPRIVSVSSTPTLTVNSTVTDQSIITAQAEALTIASPTGTAAQGQKLIIRIKDDGTARAITWNAVFRAIGITLPTTTTVSKLLYIGFIYNSTDSKWDAVAVKEEA